MRGLFYILAALTLLRSAYPLKAKAQAFKHHFSTVLAVPPSRPDFRGISGLEYLPATQEWLFVSDKGMVFSGKDLPLDSTANPALFNIQPLLDSVLPYRYEAIRFHSPTKTFYVSAENDQNTSVLAFTNLTQPTSCTSIFEAANSILNKGVEGLAIDSSGRLWIAPEAGWAQETSKSDSMVHFLRLEKNGAFQKFSYRIERFPGARFPSDQHGGISEIISTDSGSLLVLERAYHDDGQKRVVAYLYQAWVDSTKNTLKKQLLFDFNNSSQFKGKLSNVEGMAWGPRSKNGKRRLVIIADDNFRQSVTEFNQLIVLEEQ